MKTMRNIVVINQGRILTCTLFLLFTSDIFAQICSNPNQFIYGLSSAANVYRINTTNGNVGAQMNPAYTGNAASYANAIGYNNTNGRFYYFKRNSYIAPQEFVCFDPALNTITYLAPSPATTSTIINVGCVNAMGTGYYCIDAYAKLFYYNIAANTWTLITSTVVDQFGNNLTPIVNARIYGDAAFDGLGNLWFLPGSATDFGIYKFRAPLPTTPVASITVQQVKPPTTPTPNANSFGGIAFNSTGQIFVSTNPPDDKLYRLNNNGTFTLLGTFSLSGVGNDLTSCNFPFTVLPVTWESFTAEVNADKQVVLSWSVSQQSNNKGYYVERSADGINYETLVFVPNDIKQSGAAKYTYVHARPLNGKHFYRIKQVDLDENANYSEVRALDVKSSIHIELSPNPATDHIQIRLSTSLFNSDAKAEIFDFSGKLVRENTLTSGVNRIDITLLPKGSYMLRVRSGNSETFHERFIRQ